VIASASTRAEAPFDRLATVGARHFCHSRVRTWNTVAATNQNANQDESDLWKGDSTSCDVDGKKRQTNARRMRCLNKSASGNRLGQNDPHPPAIDDKYSVAFYEAACASFAIRSRTSPLSRFFSLDLGS
jgi:hypothetical protein